MSLIKHPALAGKLVHAWTETAWRMSPEKEGDREETRFRFTVDESDNILGVVGEHYKLVTNADFVSALDLAADERGIRLEPVRTKGALTGYYGGRAKYTFHAPDMPMKVGKDPSEITPLVILKNDYRGSGGLHVMSGYFRILCTNGLMRGTVAHRDLQRHVGKFDLMTFVGEALDKIRGVFEIDRLAAETLANAPVPAFAELLEKMSDATAPRYRPDLERAVRENVASIGDNAWAYVQAAAEVATHRMQQRTNFNHAADTWAARMEAIVREHAEID